METRWSISAYGLVQLLTLLCYVRFGNSQGVRPSQPVSAVIPENLKECYNDSFITTPDNLLPMTLSTFLALVRKAENDPSIGQTDLRTLTSALLHRFRFDGLMENPDVQALPGVIPYAPNGKEYSTFRLIMDYLIQDPNIFFSNNTFTRIERCTLHRMLSLSVNPWLRGDNDNQCSNLMNDVYISKLNLRIPRDISKLDLVETFDPHISSKEQESEHANLLYASNQNSYYNQRSQCPVENGVIYTPSGSLSAGLVLAGIAAGASAQDYVSTSIMNLVQHNKPNAGRPHTRDQYPVPVPVPGPRGWTEPNWNSNRNRNTFLQQNYPSQGNGGPGMSFPGNNNPNYPGGNAGYPGSNSGGYPGSNSGYPGSNSGYPGSNSGYPGSNSGYPGSNSGYPGNNPSHPGSNSGGGYGGYGPQSPESISKGWTATIAGILAQYALLQGPYNQIDNYIGIKGGWNDSISTKYYFLQDNTENNLPETRMRGALDGLIMAKSIQKWSGQAGNNNFRLSQLLTMYYSSIGVFDPTAVACNRNQRVGNVISQQETAYQTYNFASVLAQHFPGASATVDQNTINGYSSQAASDYINVLSKMGTGSCGQSNSGGSGTTGQTVGQPVAYPGADIYLVMDLSYSYQGMKNVIQMIMESALVNPYRSNITVLTAKSCPTLNSTLILSAQNTLDAQISLYNYTQCVPGFDMLFSLVQIKNLMQNKLNYDTQVGLNPPFNNDLPRIVIFVPSVGVNIDSNTAILANNKLLHFQTVIPDTKFLFLTPGPTDRWNQFSNSTNPDVFQLSREGQGFRVGINKLVQRMAQIQRRIVNPTCGSHWNRGYTYNQVTLTENLLYNEIQYFRVHPNYFYSSSTGSIVVQPTQGSVQVCWSRTNPWPSRNNTQSASSTCQSVSGGSSYTVISLTSGLCSGVSYATQCNPIFFSVQSTQSTQQSNPSTCNDQTCEFPNMINYRITHSGLTCYSSALSLVASLPLLLLLLATHLYSSST